MKKKIIITSKFNIMTGDRNPVYSSNENERFNQNWIEDRMDIFMRFTCQCLMHQSNQDFTAVYAYADSTEDYVLDALDNYDPLPINIIFVKVSDYADIIDKLSDGYDYLYLTRLDTDDLYRKNFVQTLHDYPIKDDTQELLCQYGYIYDSVNNKLANYYHLQFTFYTFIYRLYSETTKYSSLPLTPREFLTDFSHFRTIDFKYESVPGRNFILNIHGQNTNSGFTASTDPRSIFGKVEKLRDNPSDVLSIIIDFF